MDQIIVMTASAGVHNQNVLDKVLWRSWCLFQARNYTIHNMPRWQTLTPCSHGLPLQLIDDFVMVVVEAPLPIL